LLAEVLGPKPGATRPELLLRRKSAVLETCYPLCVALASVYLFQGQLPPAVVLFISIGGDLGMHTALVIIDVQNDFCSAGRLAVPDADAVIPIINDLTGEFRQVFLTQDWHPRGHVSFASSHPGAVSFARIQLRSGEQVLWPDHCIANTPGADFHRGLRLPLGAPIIRKGTRSDIDSYSALFENDRTTPVGLDALLRQANVGEIMLAGLATDFCVLHTALDARKLGYEVTVIESACRGIDANGSLTAAWSRMDQAGVRRA
jgi:nicotinamidase-related amidase